MDGAWRLAQAFVLVCAPPLALFELVWAWSLHVSQHADADTLGYIMAILIAIELPPLAFGVALGALALLFKPAVRTRRNVFRMTAAAAVLAVALLILRPWNYVSLVKYLF